MSGAMLHSPIRLNVVEGTTTTTAAATTTATTTTTNNNNNNNNIYSMEQSPS